MLQTNLYLLWEIQTVWYCKSICIKTYDTISKRCNKTDNWNQCYCSKNIWTKLSEVTAGVRDGNIRFNSSANNNNIGSNNATNTTGTTTATISSPAAELGTFYLFILKSRSIIIFNKKSNNTNALIIYLTISKYELIFSYYFTICLSSLPFPFGVLSLDV